MSTQGRNRPPGPPRRPIVGNATQAGRGLFEFLTENARSYGDVVYFEVVDEPFYQLNHPEDVESVLVGNAERFGKGRLNRELLAPLLGSGLFTSEGETWRTQRRRIQPAFDPDRIATYGDVVVDCTRRTTDGWDEGDRIDVHEAMKGLTLEVVARTLLGTDVGRDVGTVGRTLDVVLGYVDSTPNLLLPDWAPTPGNRRYRRAIAELESVVDRILAQRRADPGDDVASRLIAAGEEGGSPMSKRQLRDEVMTLLVAGHETTAVALTYAWYLLGTHPDVDRRLVAELDDVLGGDAPSFGALPQLEAIDRAITETLRLYPPANRIHREPLEDVEFQGYDVPAGATVVLPQWVVHRDPRWYPDPLAFRPDRWTEAFRADLPRLAYFPFGAGPRRCVGDRFARMEMALVLATVLQRYHLELRPETSLDVEAAVTTRPLTPVWATVQRRA
jgi:cytochrome P450